MYEDLLRKLDPDFARKVRAIVDDLGGHGFKIVPYSGYRSSIEQAGLYAQGRTRPGPVVTDAEPGSSFHNYGLACDFYFLPREGWLAWDKRWPWKLIGRSARAHKCVWGGRWPRRDRGHVEFRKKSLKRLRREASL